MAVHDHSQHDTPNQRGFLTWRWGLVLIGFLVIAGALLLTEHRAHVLGALIWLPLLLCPLMHLFMHGGHGGHGSPGSHDDRGRSAR
jgi:hypothetical protein